MDNIENGFLPVDVRVNSVIVNSLELAKGHLNQLAWDKLAEYVKYYGHKRVSSDEEWYELLVPREAVQHTDVLFEDDVVYEFFPIKISLHELSEDGMGVYMDVLYESEDGIRHEEVESEDLWCSEKFYPIACDLEEFYEKKEKSIEQFANNIEDELKELGAMPAGFVGEMQIEDLIGKLTDLCSTSENVRDIILSVAENTLAMSSDKVYKDQINRFIYYTEKKREIIKQSIKNSN